MAQNRSGREGKNRNRALGADGLKCDRDMTYICKQNKKIQYKMIRKTKKCYQRPTMVVVEINSSHKLLAGSSGSGGFRSDPNEEDMD